MSIKNGFISGGIGTKAADVGYSNADPANGIFDVQELILPPEINLNRVSTDGNHLYGITGYDSINKEFNPDVGNGIAHVVYTTDNWDSYDWFRLPGTDYYDDIVMSPDGNILAAMVVQKSNNFYKDYFEKKYLQIFVKTPSGGGYIWQHAYTYPALISDYKKVDIFGEKRPRTNIFNMKITGPSSGNYTLEYLFSTEHPDIGTPFYQISFPKRTHVINSSGFITGTTVTSTNTSLYPRAHSHQNIWDGKWTFDITREPIKTFYQLVFKQERGSQHVYYGAPLTHTIGPTKLPIDFAHQLYEDSGGYSVPEIVYVREKDANNLFAICVSSNINYNRNRSWNRVASILYRGSFASLAWNKEIQFSGYDNHYKFMDCSNTNYPAQITVLVKSSTRDYYDNATSYYGKGEVTNNRSLYYTDDILQDTTVHAATLRYSDSEKLPNSHYWRKFGVVKIDPTVCLN